MRNIVSLLIALGLVSVSAHVQAAKLKKADNKMKPGYVFKDCPDCPEMVVIPQGRFDMGSNTGQEKVIAVVRGQKGKPSEMPVHSVTIAKSFAIGKTEVTQAQWQSIMESNPSEFKNCGETCPVEQVSWNDTQEFIEKINAITGKKYRLPTEAEWEYACRAGGQHEYCGSDSVDSVAWYGAESSPKGNSEETTNPVAMKAANAFGLYDMSGNVSEWVEDNYHANYNGAAPASRFIEAKVEGNHITIGSPKAEDKSKFAPSDGSAWLGGGDRVTRGGSWSGLSFFGETGPEFVRAARRENIKATTLISDVGFRLVREIP